MNFYWHNTEGVWFFCSSIYSCRSYASFNLLGPVGDMYCFSITYRMRGLWLAETFSAFPLPSLNGLLQNLPGSKNSTSSTKFVFFGPIWKTRRPFWPLIVWDIIWQLLKEMIVNCLAFFSYKLYKSVIVTVFLMYGTKITIST